MLLRKHKIVGYFGTESWSLDRVKAGIRGLTEEVSSLIEFWIYSRDEIENGSSTNRFC